MRALLLAVAILAPGLALAAAWESPEFAAATRRPKRIAILPAQAEMVRTRVNDAVPFVKETAALEDALRQSAAGSLRSLGYEPDAESLSREKLAADPQLTALVRRLEAQVSAIVDVASGRPRDVGRGRFSVGEEALPLQRATGADAFLWLQSQSIVPSKGQRTLGSIFSVIGGTYAVPSNRTQAVAFLVDARTGDLASVAVAQSGGAVLKEPAKVAATVVGELFRQWPSFTAARRVSPKRLAAQDAQEKPEVPLAGENVEELATIERFEDAVARLEGRIAAGPAEVIDARDEFTDEGEAIAARGAPEAEPASLFEPAPEGAPAPAAEPPRGVAPPSGVTPPRALWAAPAAAPSREVILQMSPGAPGVTVRNATREPVLVSVDLAEWVEIAPGAERDMASGPGSRRILVASPSGAELARANVLVSSSRATAEILHGR